MSRPAVIEKWTRLSTAAQALVLFIFFCGIIVARIVLETALLAEKPYLSYYVLGHHFFWFLGVALWQLACFKHIAGAEDRLLVYGLLAAPVVHIPVLNAWLTGAPLRLTYLDDGALLSNMWQMLTLMCGHPRNSPFFFELLVLAVLFVAASYLVSRSVEKTFLNVLVGFYGSFVFFGMNWFGVFPHTGAILKIPTAFDNHQLHALVYFAVSLVVFIALVLGRVRHFFSGEGGGENAAAFFKGMIALSLPFFGVLFVFSEFQFEPELEPADYALVSFPYAAGYSLARAAVRSDVPVSHKLCLGFFAVCGGALVLPAIAERLVS